MSVKRERDSPLPVPGSKLGALASACGLEATEERFFLAADGSRLRYAHWRCRTMPPRGVVLLLNGRTEFIEKNIEIVADLSRNGFDVWALDWRGQGLSSRALGDRHKGHIDDYRQFLDDLHRFVTEITDLPEREEPKVMLAHSMGGHIGLRYLHDHPGMVDVAAFSAPMIDIRVNTSFLRWLNRRLMRTGFARRYALGQGRYRPYYLDPDDPNAPGSVADYRRVAARFRFLSSDARRVRALEQAIRENPALALGGPTHGWLEATFASIDMLLAPGFVEAITTPVLIVGPAEDLVVVSRRQREVVARMTAAGRQARFLEIDHAGHELFVECDDVRDKFLAEVGDWIGLPLTLPPPDLEGCVRP
jgi:lysophospholipase